MKEYADFRDGFAAAMDPRFHTIEWLDEQLINGNLLFTASENAAIIVELMHFPSGAKAIHGRFATGPLEEITGQLIPIAEEWAKKAGATYAFIDSREAWGRLLPDYDAYKSCIIKEL